MKNLSLAFMTLAASLAIASLGFSLGDQVQPSLVLRCITGTFASGAVAFWCWPWHSRHSHELDYAALQPPSRSLRSPHHQVSSAHHQVSSAHNQVSTERPHGTERHSAPAPSKGNS